MIYKVFFSDDYLKILYSRIGIIIIVIINITIMIVKHVVNISTKQHIKIL